MHRLHVAALLAIYPFVSACSSPPPPEPPKLTPWITLVPGSSLSVSSDTAGGSEIEVKIPAGAAGAGTYVSTDPALTDDARAAKSALATRGATIVIMVDTSGRLLAIRSVEKSK